MQVALETAHQGARQIETEPGRLRVYLKRMKKTFRVSHSAPAVAEPNHHPIRLPPGIHRQFLPPLFLHGAFAVLGQVQEYLHEALPVGPHRGQIFLNLPPAGDARVPEGRLDHDP